MPWGGRRDHGLKAARPCGEVESGVTKNRACTHARLASSETGGADFARLRLETQGTSRSLSDRMFAKWQCSLRDPTTSFSCAAEPKLMP